jgi:CRP/FNR family transcriptional regulator, cyclic AMP receptor protein
MTASLQTVVRENETARVLANLGNWGLPASLVSEITRENIVVQHPKGFRLFAHGTPADVVMIIVSGVVKIYCSNGNGRRFMIQLAGPSEVIGYTDFLDNRGRRCQVFEAEAMTNCSVALVVRERITRQLQSMDSGVLVALVEQLNSFWTAIAYRYASLMNLGFRERLEVALAEVASRFGVHDSRGVVVTLEFGHEEWAEMIGSSRPMVSRLFAQMIDANQIAREGKHYILLNEGGIDHRAHFVTRPSAQQFPLAAGTFGRPLK